MKEYNDKKISTNSCETCHQGCGCPACEECFGWAWCSDKQIKDLNAELEQV